MVKNAPASAGDVRDAGLMPGSGRFLEEGHGNPLQYSCQDNPMERGAWLSPYGRKESDLIEATEHTAWVCDPTTKIPHTVWHG